MSVPYTRKTVQGNQTTTRSGWRNSKVAGAYPDSPLQVTVLTGVGWPSPWTWGQPEAHPKSFEAYKIAYDRFVGRAQERADMLANLAELGSTVDTVWDAAEATCRAVSQMVQGVKALKRGKASKAKRHFRKAKDVFGAGDLKQFNDTLAGAVLAVNWGLVPVFEDVTKTLNDDMRRRFVNGARVSGRGGASHNTSSREYRESRTSAITAKISAWVSVSNPSLYQAARTGITNPLATAWELTPFSFVVDWFVNVGDVLNSYSDMHGTTVTKVNTTYRMESSVLAADSTGAQFQTDYVILKRSPGGSLSKPPLRLEISNPFTGVKRLLNQIAFFVTQSKSLRE